MILVPAGYAVKFYVLGHPRRSAESEQAGRSTLLESELAMHQRLTRDPSLPVPRLVAQGPLGQKTHYLVMTLIPGVPFSTVRHRLPEQRVALLSWLGGFVRRLHALPLAAAETAEEWPRFSAWVHSRLPYVADRLAENRALPEHLQDEVEGWMPTADEMMGSPEQAVVLHGSLQWKHLLGHVEGDVFRPTGVVDLNSGAIGSPMLDVGRIWKRVLGADQEFAAKFMEHSEIGAVDEPGFAKRALAWGLMCSPHVPIEIPWLAEVADLDELAERSFGGFRLETASQSKAYVSGDGDMTAPGTSPALRSRGSSTATVPARRAVPARSRPATAHRPIWRQSAS